VQKDVFPVAYYYQFDRAYQLVEWSPNPPLCAAPVSAGYPYGNPNLPYYKCHSGELYYEFATFGTQRGLPFRDTNDVTFTRLVIDYWTAFIRAHDPNPPASYLAARGYTSTLDIAKKTGAWAPVTKKGDTLRRLDVTPSQSPFLEVEQCKVLGLPIDYYLVANQATT
jgi:hypothetical protein